MIDVMLVMIKEISRRTKQGSKICLYYCVCGKFKEIAKSSVKSGNTKSCGCFKLQTIRKNNTTHGLSNTPEHNSWMGMKNRCYNKNNEKYYTYGARGIKVCDRWLGDNGFINFLNDMGNKPDPKTSIHRIDNNKDYCPENCKWGFY